jgi:hypothetical protein
VVIEVEDNTNALSILLNLALFTSSRGLDLKATSLTSPPMCSPSLSQSVQMKRALAPRALFAMFVAIASFSYNKNKRHISRLKIITYVLDLNTHRSGEETLWGRVIPF